MGVVLCTPDSGASVCAVYYTESSGAVPPCCKDKVSPTECPGHLPNRCAIVTIIVVFLVFSSAVTVSYELTPSTVLWVKYRWLNGVTLRDTMSRT